MDFFWRIIPAGSMSRAYDRNEQDAYKTDTEAIEKSVLCHYFLHWDLRKVSNIGHYNTKASIRMELQSTLEGAALQLKNKPRTRVALAGVVQKIMKTRYETRFPNAENRSPGPNPDCPEVLRYSQDRLVA